MLSVPFKKHLLEEPTILCIHIDTIISFEGTHYFNTWNTIPKHYSAFHPLSSEPFWLTISMKDPKSRLLFPILGNITPPASDFNCWQSNEQLTRKWWTIENIGLWVFKRYFSICYQKKIFKYTKKLYIKKTKKTTGGFMGITRLAS